MSKNAGNILHSLFTLPILAALLILAPAYAEAHPAVLVVAWAAAAGLAIGSPILFWVSIVALGVELGQRRADRALHESNEVYLARQAGRHPGARVARSPRGRAGLVLLLLAVGAIAATPARAEDVSAEIRERCERTMAAYGRALVLHCVKEDTEAVARIVELQEQHPAIVESCLRRMRSFGFALVAYCIDEDLQADAKLEALR